MTATAPGRQRLKGLSEAALLEELVARYRAALVDDGVPGRLLRRGYGHVVVEFSVQEYDFGLFHVTSRHSGKVDDLGAPDAA